MQSILESILELDKNLFLWLNQLGHTKWDSMWLWITEKSSWIPFYALLLITAILKLKKWKVILAFVIFIAVLITLVDQSITLLFKPGFARFRPCHDESLITLMRQVVSNCGGKYSFFSAHAANSFALAFFFIRVLQVKRWAALFLFFWASIVAYSRIYVGVHFPLDVTVGALWGILIASGLHFLWLKLMLLKV